MEEESPADTVCEVFIDYEIEGLSMSHFQVTKFHVEPDENLIKPEIVFRYDPEDYE